jgi:hypothetical protein
MLELLPNDVVDHLRESKSDEVAFLQTNMAKRKPDK